MIQKKPEEQNLVKISVNSYKFSIKKLLFIYFGFHNKLAHLFRYIL